MKKIILILISIICLSSTAYAFENENKISDEKTEYINNFIIPDLSSFDVKIPEAFTDCNDSHITTLLRLGFISGFEDKTFRPQNILTRAEGTKLAVFAATNKANISSLIAQQYYEPIFSDITKEHWSSTFVTVASKLYNLTDGFGDGTFRPDDTLTKLQFSKMLVCVLGFKNEAIVEGGYPDGYKKTAEKLGIAKDITDAPLTRAEAALMLYNSLFASVNVIEGYEMIENSVAQISSKETMMNYIHNIRAIRGQLQVTDNSIVTIGNENFIMGYNDAEKFSEENMLHFIQKDENGYEIWLASN